jgi:hypothetical protein
MDCKWNTTLIHAEVKTGVELLMLPTNIGPCREREEQRKWIPDKSVMFSVHLTYNFPLDRQVVEAIEHGIQHAIQKLWLNDILSKVSIFCRRSLLAKLRTRGCQPHFL